MKLKQIVLNAKLSRVLAWLQSIVFTVGILSAAAGIYVWSAVRSGRDPAGLKRQAPWMTAVLLFFCAVLVLAAAFSAFYYSKHLLKPLHALADAARRFSEGDLKIRLDGRSENEIGAVSASLNAAFAALEQDVKEISGTLSRIAEGDLAVEVGRDYRGSFAPVSDAFRRILKQLNRTFGAIESTSDQVDSGAQQISTTAQQLAQGATEQASSVEELSSSTEEISENIRATSKHLAQVTSFLEETTRDVDRSNQQMRQMLSAMEGINSASDEIRQIIKVIDEIAFQTNILALNAAVEAARAGEAGKGFAVVADEVRSLAGKSAGAASQTTALIEDSITKVKDGTVIANQAAQTLSEVAARVVKVNGSVEKINGSAAAQANAAQQITQGIEQISSVVQTNSASAEESAAASEELSGQASLLRQELEKFRLKKNALPPARPPVM